MTFDIRDHLEKLEPNPRESGKYFCPACGGHNLSINLANGAYNCWSDNTEEHRNLIRENLSPASLVPTRAEPGIRRWKYYTAHGEPAVDVVRQDFAEENVKKKIRRENQRKELFPDLAPLYWADCIKEHTENGGRIFIVEGEQAADAMRSLGLNAICFIGGSGEGYLRERYHDLLYPVRDSLVLVPDMDRPGVQEMNRIAIDFPDALWLYVQGPNYHFWGAEKLPEKHGYDITDAIRNGATQQTVLQWIHRKQSFALTGEALEADVEVNEMIEGLVKVYVETADVTVRELKVAQYLKKSGLKDLGWTIQRAMKHCAAVQFNAGVVEVLDAHDLISMPTKRPRWLIPGFLPAASVVLLGASGGTGKSTLCYQLAKHIALGEPWSDFPVVKGRVMIISTDESTHDTKEKLQTIDYGQVPRGGVSFIRFWRFNQIDLLEEKIRLSEPSLVVIDSLTSTTAGLNADRTSSSAGDCLYELRDLAEKYECTFMVLHHLNKKDEFRDSTTYVDNVSEAWKLSRDENKKGDFILSYEKSRSGFQGQAILRRRLEQYKWEMIGRIDSTSEWHTEQKLARWINENLRKNGVQHWLTAEQLASQVPGITPGEINTTLPTLRLNGRISCDTTIVGGITVRKYAAWDAQPYATEPTNVVPLFEPEETIEDELPADALDDLRIIVRSSFTDGLPAEQLSQMLETYPWSSQAEKALFWRGLDADLRHYLAGASRKGA